MEQLKGIPPQRSAEFDRYPAGKAYLEALTEDTIMASDLECIVQICNQPAVKQWVSGAYATGDNDSYTEADAHQFVKFANSGWEEGSAFVYTIRNQEHVLVGVIDIKSADKNEAEIGYWADTTDRGRGYMTGAVLALCTLARQAGYKSLFGYVDPANNPSSQVLIRAGFIDGGVETSNRHPDKQVLRFTKNLAETVEA